MNDPVASPDAKEAEIVEDMIRPAPPVGAWPAGLTTPENAIACLSTWAKLLRQDGRPNDALSIESTVEVLTVLLRRAEEAESKAASLVARYRMEKERAESRCAAAQKLAREAIAEVVTTVGHGNRTDSLLVRLAALSSAAPGGA